MTLCAFCDRPATGGANSLPDGSNPVPACRDHETDARGWTREDLTDCRILGHSWVHSWGSGPPMCRHCGDNPK